jgi:hypothetical protein
MGLDGDLDDELRQLFTSDRLDVSVRADADQVILAGARRVRRRRIATATASGVFAIVVAVIGGIALAGGNPDAMPPATTKPPTPPAATSAEVTSLPAASSAAAPPLAGTTTTTTKTPKAPPPTKTSDPRPPVLNYAVLGPTGFRALELGQTLEDAQATGLLGAIVEDGGAEGCSVYELASRPSGQVYVSGTVQAIVADPVQTPEGVGKGWTIAQVKTVYPEVDEEFAAEDGRFLVSVPGNSAAHYRLDFAGGLVTGVSLQAADRTCY